MPPAVHHFAILAPVPLEHLETGMPIAEATGYVAFGTAKWELFQRIDTMRDGAQIPVLIYPSWGQDTVTTGLKVSWFGWYIGHTHSKGGAHTDGMTHRPPSTEKYGADNKGHWAAFWHVSGLRKLEADNCMPISKVPTIKGGWRKNAPPRGPELVALPEQLSYEI
jgi:hypothetical protein